MGRGRAARRIARSRGSVKKNGGGRCQVSSRNPIPGPRPPWRPLKHEDTQAPLGPSRRPAPRVHRGPVTVTVPCHCPLSLNLSTDAASPGSPRCTWRLVAGWRELCSRVQTRAGPHLPARSAGEDGPVDRPIGGPIFPRRERSDRAGEDVPVARPIDGGARVSRATTKKPGRDLQRRQGTWKGLDARQGQRTHRGTRIRSLPQPVTGSALQTGRARRDPRRSR